tara:strand:- start:2106 stop:2249 length:144 start_codon:yes stop_codon:yes gene_type:complete
MTASLIVSLGGVVVLVVGSLEIISMLKEHRRTPSGFVRRSGSRLKKR